MTKANYIFALISLCLSVAIGCLVLPDMLGGKDIISKLFTLLYERVENNLPYPKITYISIICIFLFLMIWAIFEKFWEIIEDKPLTTRGSAHWATKYEVKDLIKI